MRSIPISVTLSLLLICQSSSNASSVVSGMELRYVNDIAQFSPTKFSEHPGSTWLILKFDPVSPSGAAGNSTVYLDPLTRKTEKLPGADGDLAIEIVGTATVVETLVGDTPKSPFTYAWAQALPTDEDNRSAGSHLAIEHQWPFSNTKGYAVVRYDPSRSGEDVFKEIYAVPLDFIPSIVKATELFKADPNIFDAHFASANRDRLRLLAKSSDALVACVAAKLLWSIDDSDFLLDILSHASGSQKSVLLLLGLSQGGDDSLPVIEKFCEASINAKQSTDDLKQFAIASRLALINPHLPKQSKLLATTVLSRSLEILKTR